MVEGFDLQDFVPYEERKLIIYCTRDLPGVNDRHVANEAEILAGLRDLIAERGEGEELIVFDPRNYGTLREAARLFSTARAVIGIHGAAFYNLFFCPPGTLVYEFGGAWAARMHFFHIARILGFEYLYYYSEKGVRRKIVHRDGAQQKEHTIHGVDKLVLHLSNWLDRPNTDTEKHIARWYD